jgi:hypothetical protein
MGSQKENDTEGLMLDRDGKILDVECLIEETNFCVPDGDCYPWLGKGDIFFVRLPRKRNELPRLRIQDKRDQRLKLEFEQDSTVPFRCKPLSEHSQFITFSAKLEDITYCVEIFRQRKPVPLQHNPENNEIRVDYFLYSLSSVDTHGGGNNGNGGGWQRF